MASDGYKGGRSQGGAGWLTSRDGVTGLAAGDRARGSLFKDRAGNQKTGGGSTQLSGFNRGTNESRPERLALLSVGGGRGRLGGTIGDTGNLELDGTIGDEGNILIFYSTEGNYSSPSVAGVWAWLHSIPSTPLAHPLGWTMLAD